MQTFLCVGCVRGGRQWSKCALFKNSIFLQYYFPLKWHAISNRRENECHLKKFKKKSGARRPVMLRQMKLFIDWKNRKEKSHTHNTKSPAAVKRMNRQDSKGDDDKQRCRDPTRSARSRDFASSQKSWNYSLLSEVGEPTARQLIPWAESFLFPSNCVFCFKSPQNYGGLKMSEVKQKC